MGDTRDPGKGRVYWWSLVLVHVQGGLDPLQEHKHKHPPPPGQLHTSTHLQHSGGAAEVLTCWPPGEQGASAIFPPLVPDGTCRSQLVGGGGPGRAVSPK